VTGLGNGRHLANAGIHDAVELDWWQQTSARGVKVTYVPAQHCSRRTLLDYNRALSGGFVIEANGFKIYFAGDTGYNAHFRQIRS
jgi:L-ascorbate metabolism protein UlaG (beta-lactamase superfamily)